MAHRITSDGIQVAESTKVPLRVTIAGVQVAGRIEVPLGVTAVGYQIAQQGEAIKGDIKLSSIGIQVAVPGSVAIATKPRRVSAVAC